MAHIQDAGSRPARDALSGGLLSFGDQMIACFGAAQEGGPAPRGWLRRLASLGRAPVRLDDAAGLTARHLKDIGVPRRPAAPPLSADAATRLSIRANGGF